MILKTQNGVTEYSFLIDKNLFDLYFLAEQDQNIELQIYCNMLATFLIVYPFVFSVTYYSYINKDEIKNFINILVDNIDKNIQQEMNYRDDIYIRDMYNLFKKIKYLDKKKKYKYGFTTDLEEWRKSCNYLFQKGKLIEFEYTKSRTIFSHNNSFFYLYETFLPFLRYQYRKGERDTGDLSLENYYLKCKEIYNDFLKIKGVKELLEIDKEIINDERERKENKKNQDDELTREDVTKEKIEFSDTQFMRGGSSKTLKSKSATKNNKTLKKNNISILKQRKRDVKSEVKFVDENFDELERKHMNDFNAYPTGDVLKDPYDDLDFKYLTQEINLYYRQQIIERSSNLMDSRFINLFISLQMIYLIIHKTSNNYNYLHPYSMQLQQIRKYYFIKYINLVIGGYTSGLQFPLVIENRYNNIIFPNITLVKKQKIPIYKFSKMMLSDENEQKHKIDLRIKNFPIISIDETGIVKITSTNNGNLSNDKTLKGEYYSHTFSDLFLSHKDKFSQYIPSYEKVRLNMSLLKEQVNADLIPVFNTTRTDMSFNKFYLTQDMIYFIRLDSKNSKIKNLYFILDLENRGEIDKLGTYFGDINEWLGFFGMKRLYQSINKIDYEYFMRLIRYSTTRKVNLFYDKTKKYKKINDIIMKMKYSNGVQNNGFRITRDYFKKYITEGFTDKDFIKEPFVLENLFSKTIKENIKEEDNENLGNNSNEYDNKNIQTNVTENLSIKFNELFNEILNFYQLPVFSQMDNAFINKLDNTINIPYFKNEEITDLLNIKVVLGIVLRKKGVQMKK